MKEREDKHRILILGASGFLGHAIYKELCSYFKTFGTYKTSNTQLEKNNHFFQYNIEEDDVYEILDIVKPTIIISSLRGDLAAQLVAHKHIAEYVFSRKIKFIFLSSANVFDAYSKYPSYEQDKTLSNSIYGHFKIKIENMLLRMPKNQVAIIKHPKAANKVPKTLTLGALKFNAHEVNFDEMLSRLKAYKAKETKGYAEYLESLQVLSN